MPEEEDLDRHHGERRASSRSRIGTAGRGRRRRWPLHLAGGFGLVVALSLTVIYTPYPLFAYHLRHGEFDLWSDRPIPAAANAVLDAAGARIARSALWSPGERFRLFVCNDNWRLALYSLRFSGRMAGATDTVFTRNIYLRQSEFVSDRLVPPSARAVMSDRPLDYYIAHEATHVMESRAFGLAPALRYPHWLLEGYADYVGKAGNFDYAANLAQLRAGAPELDWKRSGLYRVYHLETAYYLDRRRWTVAELFQRRPNEATALAAINASAP